MQNDMNMHVDSFVSSDLRTIGKYNQITFNAHSYGLVAQCQDQKSQHKNKDKQGWVLRSRL
jgi:protein subunit release factor A